MGKTNQETKEIAKKFCAGEDIKFSDAVDEESQDFIRICMTRDPKDRATFDQIKAHAFLKDLDMKKALTHKLETKYKPGITVNAKSVVALHMSKEEDRKIKKSTKVDPENTIPRFQFVSRTHHRKAMTKAFDYMYAKADEFNALPDFDIAVENDVTVPVKAQGGGGCCVIS